VSQPGVELLEAQLVHARLAAFVAFAVADQQRPAALVDVGLVERQRFGDPQPATPQHRDQRPDPQPVAVTAGLTHDEDDLFGAGRVRRIFHPLLWGARPAR
jgi:hypothetical protein